MPRTGLGRFAAAIAAATMFLSAASVCAERSPLRPEPSASSNEARALYEEGLRHYDLAEFDLAIEKFKRAYVLSNRPELLFNLGQACRGKKDWKQAEHFYRTFLHLRPDAPNRAAVDAALAEVVAEREKPAREVPPAVVAPPPVAPPVVPPVVEVRPPRLLATRRGAAIVAVSALGGAAHVAAAATGGMTVASRRDYDASCPAGCSDVLYDRGRRTAIATDVLIGIGAASVLTAVVLALTRGRAQHPATLAVRF